MSLFFIKFGAIKPLKLITMKKIIVISLVCLFALFGYSQDTTQMDISQIPNEVGVLYEKSFIDIGEAIQPLGISKRPIKVQILEVKDLINETTEKFIRIEYFISNSTLGTRTYIFAINKKEAIGLITAMDKIMSEVKNEKKFVYTEIVFRTYEGLIVGSYYEIEKQKWTSFIKEQGDKHSIMVIKEDVLEKLLFLMRDAYKKL